MKKNKKFYRTHRRAKKMLDNMLSSGDFELIDFPTSVTELIEIVTGIKAVVMVKESLAGRCSDIEWFEDRVRKHADELRAYFSQYDEEDVPEDDLVYSGLGDILGWVYGIFGFGDGTPADYWQVTKYPSAGALQKIPHDTFKYLYDRYYED